MFETYSGQVIPDTPSRRRAVVDRLKGGTVSATVALWKASWQPPVFTARIDGSAYTYSAMILQGAIFPTSSKKSLGSTRLTIRQTRVRIHAFGFPVLFKSTKHRANRERFAHLMRALAERNAGFRRAERCQVKRRRARRFSPSGNRFQAFSFLARYSATACSWRNPHPDHRSPRAASSS